MMTIDSVAALKRIPVGTRLILRSTVDGKPSGRVVLKATKNDIIFTVDDPSSKNHGKHSFLTLLPGTKVIATPKGFIVQQAHGLNGVVYEFQDAPAAAATAPLAIAK